MTGNALQVLHPYRWQGTWVFDDERVGLVREPFVLGIDTMLDRLTADIPDAANGFRLLFSPRPFPGSMVFLEWRREDAGGHWYYSPAWDQQGWLCPALFKYFDQPPRELHARAEPLRR